MVSGIKMKVGIFALVGLVVGTDATYKTKRGEAQGPMAKVIMLLDSMTAEIKSEMAEQAAISKKLQCWAATNKKEKTAAIAKNTALVEQKEGEVKKLTALNAEQGIKIKNLILDIDEDEKTLVEAEEMRKKEEQTFDKFELETRKAIQQLGGALTVLKKFNSFVQLTPNDRSQLQNLFHVIGEKYAMALDSSDVEKARSFLQREHQTYASQSGEIFGILSQMKETMEADLEQGVNDERKAVEEFTKMRKAKRNEIKSQKDESFRTKEESARTKEALEIAKKTIKEAVETLAADKEFLEDVNQRAAADAKELEARVKSQTEELEAIAACKGILTVDENRAHLAKTVKKSFLLTNFLQVAKVTKKSDLTERAASLLRVTNNPMLQLLATQLGLSAFVKVKKAINDLIAELEKKKKDEYKKRDYCVTSFDENATATDEASFQLEDLGGLIVELEEALQQLELKIENTETEVSQLNVDTAVATDDRKKENAEYQQVFQDQKVTIEILAKAKQKLADFYNAKKSFLSERQPGGPTGLKAGGYKKRSSGGVVQMLDMIISDAKNTLQIAVDDEQAAQVAYEKFLGAARRDMGTLQKTIATDNKTKADKEEELVNAKSDQSTTLKKLEILANAKAALEGDCNFLMKNFDATQAAMVQEIEALTGAINILSGAMQ